MFSRKELLEKIRTIEIRTDRTVKEVMSGAYRSAFKGRGLEFDSVRLYVEGDDVRSVDWNVTARTGKLHVKEYTEERELNAVVVLVLQRSMAFSSKRPTKLEVCVEAAAVLAASAAANSDKVSLLVQGPDFRSWLGPGLGRDHAMAVAVKALEAASGYEETAAGGAHGDKENEGSGALLQALEFLDRVLSAESMLFVLSDFFEPVESWRESFKRLAVRHEPVLLMVGDPWERDLPDIGMVHFGDTSWSEGIFLDTSDRAVRDDYARRSRERIDSLVRLFDSVRARHGLAWTDLDYMSVLAETVGPTPW